MGNRRDHVPYEVLKAKGQVVATEGNVIHYRYIETFIEELGTIYHIKEIAFDRWGAVQMTQNLEEMGFTVVPFAQGYRYMNPPTKEIMKLVLERKLAHVGNVPLRWIMYLSGQTLQETKRWTRKSPPRESTARSHL